ncbi:hypothetical protein V2J09_001443 [Rumex salicifolius]
MNPDYPTTYQDHYTNLNATDHLGPSEEDQCSNSGGRCEGGAVEPRALDEEEMAEIRCAREEERSSLSKKANEREQRTRNGDPAN